ncbi:MAG: arginine--tRNA ligase [Candidatus Nomurabacteria bacterium]|jgi:arginyl-tRNA synthetase|nr:arginine--tRNA ligase [Candidatus Nomurabacteria bacterium]
MEKFAILIAELVKRLFNIDVEVELSRPDPKFGDFATNVAMKLAGQLHQNPREVAEKLVAELKESNLSLSDSFRQSSDKLDYPNKSGNDETGVLLRDDNVSQDDNNNSIKLFSDVTIAGPGFINLRLSDEFLVQEFSKMTIAPEKYGKSTQYAGKSVVTEFSDPNPFKELHVGHLYTTIIGEAISRLIEQAGGEVHRVNFGGDVGLHVAKAMWGIIQNLDGENPEQFAKIAEDERAPFLAKSYVAGANAYEDDATAHDQIVEYNKRVYDVQNTDDHESPFAQIYWLGRTWSYDYFNDFYQKIGMKFEKFYPESETAPIGLATVREQEKNGIYEESDGAVVFKGEKYGLHTRVFINKQGLPTYETKDVGLSIKKWDDYHFDQSVIITGNDIIEYMKVVLKSIEQFKPELSRRTLHLTHGNVKLAGVAKMSSRKGNVLRAVDVLDMVAREFDESGNSVSSTEVLGAIKYAFLKNRLGGDIVFDAKESVQTVGNSGPYLQYAAVRAKSILRGISVNYEMSLSGSFRQSSDRLDPRNKSEDDNVQFFDNHERALLMKLTEFSEALENATKELAPHLVATYLYELAQTFNRFYENSRVAGDPREELRARLVMVYAEFLKRGLNILGIEVPEKM